MTLLTYVSIAVTLALLLWSLSKGLKRTRLRAGFDAARIVIQIAVAVAIPLITGVTTPAPLIIGASVLGLALGFEQGQRLRVECERDSVFVSRSVAGLVVWGVGLLLMQGAGLANRTGLLQLGQAITWFSVGIAVGLMIGRHFRVNSFAQAAAVATAAVLCVMTIVALAPNAPSASAQTSGVWVRDGGRVIGGAPFFPGWRIGIGVGGGSVDFVVDPNPATGQENGRYNNTVSYGAPPQQLAPGETATVSASITPGALNFDGDLFSRVQVLALLGSTPMDLVAEAVYSCRVRVGCTPPPADSGSFTFSLPASANPGDTTVVGWLVQNCGGPCRVEYTYTWEAAPEPPPTTNAAPATTSPPVTTVQPATTAPPATTTAPVTPVPSATAPVTAPPGVEPPQPADAQSGGPDDDTETFAAPAVDEEDGAFAAQGLDGESDSPEDSDVAPGESAAADRFDSNDVSDDEALLTAVTGLLAAAAAGLLSLDRASDAIEALARGQSAQQPDRAGAANSEPLDGDGSETYGTFEPLDGEPLEPDPETPVWVASGPPVVDSAVLDPEPDPGMVDPGDPCAFQQARFEWESRRWREIEMELAPLRTKRHALDLKWHQERMEGFYDAGWDLTKFALDSYNWKPPTPGFAKAMISAFKKKFKETVLKEVSKAVTTGNAGTGTNTAEIDWPGIFSKAAASASGVNPVAGTASPMSGAFGAFVKQSLFSMFAANANFNYQQFMGTLSGGTDLADPAATRILNSTGQQMFFDKLSPAIDVFWRSGTMLDKAFRKWGQGVDERAALLAEASSLVVRMADLEGELGDLSDAKEHWRDMLRTCREQR